MIFKEPTCYSAICSMGFHMVFVLMAGSFWLSQAEPPPPEKSFQLKVVSKPPPQPAVTKQPRVKKAFKKRNVAANKMVPLPKPQRRQEVTQIKKAQKTMESLAVPDIGSRSLKPLNNFKSDRTPTQRTVTAKKTLHAVSTLPTARIFKPSDHTQTRPDKTVRVAQFQQSGPLPHTALSSPRSFKPSGDIKADSGKTPRADRVDRKGSEVLASNGSAIPHARHSLEGMNNRGVSGKKIAKVQIDQVPETTDTIFPQALNSWEPVGTGKAKHGRVARVEKRSDRIHASKHDPRTLPNVLDNGATRGYLTGIGTKIASVKEYPREAKIAGQEGEVRVQFTILKNGQIRDLLLVSATPYAALNNEALDMVKRAAPFSHLPEEIGMPFLKVVLPFTFRLN